MLRKSDETTPSVRMRGFLNDWPPRSGSWPNTYVVVETNPRDWMATITLSDLAEVLGKRPEASLRDVPFRWDGDELVVVFGPVRVRGTEESWRRLGSAVVDTAGSAAELYETPAARPWTGPTTEVAVDQVEVTWMPRRFPDAELNPDSLLAQACGFAQGEFDDLLGTGWRRWEGSGGPSLDPELFLWGQPTQLAAELYVDGTVRVGRPGGSWPGPGELVMEAVDPVTIERSSSREELEPLVKDLLRRRRRSFSWCRYCGGLFAPEHRLERNVCYGCGTEVLGVVY